MTSNKNKTKNQKKPRHVSLNANSIVRRLSFHQQLNESQSSLIKCAPIWHEWAKKNLASDTTKNITLSHFSNGELNIHCQNSINATQIKQQQQTLLEYFQNQGILEIKKITVNINNNPPKNSQKNKQVNNDQFNPNDNLKENLESPVNGKPDSLASLKLRNNAIKSIESCQKITSNKELSESLNRLKRTIEELND